MIKINENYLKLQATYLFTKIARRVNDFQKANPEIDVIKLGIGDVTRALPKACIDAFHQGVDDLSRDRTFHGYGPEKGYAFLREEIAANDFQKRGADIDADEIFISDGSKCDTGNFQELFALDTKIAVPDPVYPVYIDTNVMAGRTGGMNDGRYDNILYMESGLENNFIPSLPREPADLIYLCFPNNPTGATITKQALKTWVDYAREHKSLILYDAAYESFIRDEQLPHTIFEIEGAREVAVEFRSFSKTAGFTGTRCAHTIVPKACMAWDSKGQAHSVHALWNRRNNTKFNGVSYPVQRAAAAVYSPEGKQQTRELIDYYLENAALVRREISAMGFDLVGGENSPYIWLDTRKDAWEFFDLMLEKAGVVCTPGPGFGKCGQGFVRISAFNSRDNVEKAIARIKTAVS
jgi:LL-diaminopimelate aminotransferase